MKYILSILLALVTFAGISQKTYYADYDWKSKPDKFTLTEVEQKEDEVTLFEKKSVEFFATNDDRFIQVELMHTIKSINTDAGIEENNKVYVSNGSNSKVLKQQARVIKPDGSITVLKEGDIKESKDEDGDVEYRYFAMEGLEKGSIIEYLHYIESDARYTGSSMVIQNEYSKRKVELDILSPQHLEFATRSMNGMPQFIKDSTESSVKRIYVSVDHVKGLKKEEWSAYRANLMKVYYKLDKNIASGKNNIVSYTNFGKNIYEELFMMPGKAELKKIKAYVKKANNHGETLEEKLRFLENELKSEFNIIEIWLPIFEDFPTMLKSKLTTEAGFTKLMVACLREMGVKNEVVLTADRQVSPFLTDFEASNFLQDYLIYLPEINKYFSPTRFTRIGFVPAEFTNTNGLFIEERVVGENRFGVSKVKFIEATKSTESVDEINTELTFDETMMEPTVKIERKLSGYKAQYPQFFLDFVDGEQRNEMKLEVLQYMDESGKVIDTTYENAKSSDGGVKPFIARGTMQKGNFVETAGNKILLKVGLLIGPQAEMYNKGERMLPVENMYTREYNRQIVVNIPAGKTIKNPEILTMNVASSVAGDETKFVSTYEIKGNQLIVTIREVYSRINYPISDYPVYEKVINAAADFNKLVLVIE